MDSEMEIEHCLFCQEKRSPFSIIHPSANKSKSSRKSTLKEIGTFKIICKHLKINLSEEILKKVDQEGNNRTERAFCETFLCLPCSEIVEGLEKLHYELEEITRKIAEASSKLQNLIKSSELNTKKRERGKSEQSESELKEFCTLFRSLAAKPSNELKEKTELSTENVAVEDEDEGVVHENYLDAMMVVKVEETLVDNVDPESNVWNNDYDFESEECEDSQEWEPEGYEQEELTNSREPEEVESDTETSRTRRLRKRKAVTYNEDDGDGCSTIAKQRKEVKSVKKCLDCDKEFSCQKKFDQHRYTQHRLVNPEIFKIIPSRKVFCKGDKRLISFRKCLICGLELRGRHEELNNYMIHMIGHDKDVNDASTSNPLLVPNFETPFECHLCKASFHMEFNLKLHFHCVHQPSKCNLTCDACGAEKYRTREDLIDHLKTHTNSMYSCKSCPLSYTKLDNLLQHMYRHARMSRLECPICDDFTAESMKEINKHCEEAHAAHKRKNYCPTCDKYFSSPQNFKQHLYLSHSMSKEDAHAFAFGLVSQEQQVILPEKVSWVCEHCDDGKSFNSVTTLETHMKKVHFQDAKKFSCDECDKTFLHKSELARHKESVHAIVAHQCPHCPKQFKDKQRFKEHMNIHTGAASLCDICSKIFPTVRELERHKRDVHIPRNHTCDLCGKSVKSKRSLNGHIQRHHGEKKLTCQLCPLKFMKQRSLNKHLRVDHKMKLPQRNKNKDGKEKE